MPPSAPRTSPTVATFGSGDRLGSLIPELRAEIYSYLRSYDGYSLAATSSYYRHGDAELWRHLARPFRHVPMNAGAMWSARLAERHRVAMGEADKADDLLAQKLNLQWYVFGGLGAVMGAAAGVAWLAVMGALEGDQDITARDAKALGTCVLFGAYLATAFPAAQERTLRERRAARAAETPKEVVFPVAEAPYITRVESTPPDAVRAFLQSLRPLRHRHDSDEPARAAWDPPEHRPRDIAFFDSLHLTPSLNSALGSAKHILPALQALPYLETDELHRVLFETLNPIMGLHLGASRLPALREAIHRASVRDVHDIAQTLNIWNLQATRSGAVALQEAIAKRLPPPPTQADALVPATSRASEI